MMKFGIIREGKTPPDERVPLAPEQCVEVIEKFPVKLQVQSSKVRRFKDEEYKNVGVEINAPFPFNGPTLFVRGERSNYVLDEDLADIKNKFPNMKLETISGSGHWVHAEKPKEFLAIIKSFLC